MSGVTRELRMGRLVSVHYRRGILVVIAITVSVEDGLLLLSLHLSGVSVVNTLTLILPIICLQC